jgi:pyruvate ferredoxin oxidoreductase alpha subunit
LAGALAGKVAVAVIDQNVSMGAGGILYGEVSALMAGREAAPRAILSFIGGLGGRDIGPEEFYEIAGQAARAGESGEVPAPRLLYTAAELREMQKLQAIAHVERQPEGAGE